MEPKVLSSFDEAVGDIPAGASILLGGFGPGTAHNLMAALHRQGARDLTLIANTTSPGGGAPQGIVTGTTLGAERRVGKGIPAFYTPTGVGTEVAEGKEHRVFNGRTYILEQAITADYAFVRAWRADEFGNLVYRLSQRNFNPLMAAAARCTIAEVEEIVPIGSIDPDHVHTPGIYVQRIVKIGADDVLHTSFGPSSVTGSATRRA